MRVIRFELQGLLNSYRIPFFRSYHKSLLAPPKTTLIGMLCNIALKSQKEFFEILEDDKIELSIVIKEIGGKTKDLWSYKTREKKNRGKSVVRRDKFFQPYYLVYLHIKDDILFDEILHSLRKPKNIPSLGLDDELVVIQNIDVLEMLKSEVNCIDSIFLDKNFNYKVKPKDISKPIQLPTSHLVPTKFKGFDTKGKRISREVTEEFLQVEYINCEVEFAGEIPIYSDTKHSVLFY